MKKLVKSKVAAQKWWPRSGCVGLIMAKILIATIQMNFGADSQFEEKSYEIKGGGPKVAVVV